MHTLLYCLLLQSVPVWIPNPQLQVKHLWKKPQEVWCVRGVGEQRKRMQKQKINHHNSLTTAETEPGNPQNLLTFGLNTEHVWPACCSHMWFPLFNSLGQKSLATGLASLFEGVSALMWQFSSLLTRGQCGESYFRNELHSRNCNNNVTMSWLYQRDLTRSVHLILFQMLHECSNCCQIPFQNHCQDQAKKNTNEHIVLVF